MEVSPVEERLQQRITALQVTLAQALAAGRRALAEYEAAGGCPDQAANRINKALRNVGRAIVLLDSSCLEIIDPDPDSRVPELQRWLMSCMEVP